MTDSTQPLVAVVTPVYNGEAYLRECIESVLAQTYPNWQFIILNNCSRDGTPDIARQYAARDARVHVVCNEQFLAQIDNHNAALRLIPPEAKYCKPLMADDWLTPNCLAAMVDVAERFPSVGLVCCYAHDGRHVLWDGVPYPGSFMRGADLCRATLLGEVFAFGTPTSNLFRADLVRARPAFYNPENTHADMESCYDVLRQSDFGFVHEVLAFNREHPGSQSAAEEHLDSRLVGTLTAAVKFAPIFLSPEEAARKVRIVFASYYQMLAKSALRLRGRDFWEFHRGKLRQCGYRLNRITLARAVGRELLEALTRPRLAWDGVRTWWPRAAKRAFRRSG